MSVLLDTGFLFARLHVRDVHHDAARTLETEMLEGVHGGVLTTTFVVDELMTLIQARGAGHPAVQAGADLLGLEGSGPALATVLEIDRGLIEETWVLFDRHYEDGLRFTDCSHLAAMDHWDIDELATFDAGFEGLVDVVPETG